MKHDLIAQRPQRQQRLLRLNELPLCRAAGQLHRAVHHPVGRQVNACAGLAGGAGSGDGLAQPVDRQGGGYNCLFTQNTGDFPAVSGGL